MTRRATPRPATRGPAGSAETTDREAAGPPPRRLREPIKVVPEPRKTREALRAQCTEAARHLDKSQLLSKRQMQSIAGRILDDLGHPRCYTGWTMVALASAFWREQVASVPPDRRLLLLPHCLRHATGCPAKYNELGMDCKRCGACSIAEFRAAAEQLGYSVLVAEGSPVVLKIIIGGHVDAIVGVACLNVLERAIDKILLAGIPCMAVPLLQSTCRNTSVDEDWVHEMIRLRQGIPSARTHTYLHLLRLAEGMFRCAELDRLVPPQYRQPRADDNGQQDPVAMAPVAATEAIARDFLARGGKHVRPFITLAVHDAVTGAKGTLPDGPKHLAALPDAVRRTALTIETFHKASLVHDDIEDDDAFRYGKPTLHREWGIPTAINVGDYLIGLGYRLVSQEHTALGAETAADILDHLAAAHMKLCEGQGAELLWRDTRNKELAPADVLRIYALKTAPAFEVALYTGLRLAGAVHPYLAAIKKLARNLGIAFQILNDLRDWQGDDNNKLRVGADALRRRPTILWALAAEKLPGNARSQIERLLSTQGVDEQMIARVRELYQTAGLFDTAYRLVDKYQERAEAVVAGVGPDPLRRLFHYLIDTVLERPAGDEPEVVPAKLPPGLPVVA